MFSPTIWIKSWSISNSMKKRLEAEEMFFWRKIMKL